MPRIRKGPNRYWSKYDKLKIINEVLVNCRSSYEVAKEYDISSGMLRGWIIKYNKFVVCFFKLLFLPIIDIMLTCWKIYIFH